MNFKISDDQNTMWYNGKVYEARPELPNQICEGCVFWSRLTAAYGKCAHWTGKCAHWTCTNSTPPCSGKRRNDKRNIIWVEKQKREQPEEDFFVYVAGALNADACKYLRNVHKMNKFAIELKRAGYRVFNPCLDLFEGIQDGNMGYEDYFDNNAAWIKFCDAIFLVPGWENSKGVAREIKIAEQAGIPVVSTIDALNGLRHRKESKPREIDIIERWAAEFHRVVQLMSKSKDGAILDYVMHDTGNMRKLRKDSFAAGARNIIKGNNNQYTIVERG